MKRVSAKGFTLIELIVVIAIIGILAAVAIPKFIDLSQSARIGATRGTLGAVRSVLAIKYAQSATGGGIAAYPGSLTSADFADNQDAKNALVGATVGVETVSTVPSGTATSTDAGFWYISSGASAGRAGAYSGTGTDNVNTSAF